MSKQGYFLLQCRLVIAKFELVKYQSYVWGAVRHEMASGTMMMMSYLSDIGDVYGKKLQWLSIKYR